MKLFSVSFVSWVASLLAYFVVLSARGVHVRDHDLRTILFWSSFGTLVSVNLIYAPVMFELRSRARRLWTFPATGMALGVVPAIVIVSLWTDNTGRALVSAEASLFYVLFGVFGAVFGLVFALSYPRHRITISTGQESEQEPTQ